MKRLTISAAVNTFTGYGQMFAEIFAGLEQRGVFCSVRAIEISEPFGAKIPVEISSRYVHCPQPEPFELLIRNPNHLPTPGRKTVYYTMYETTRLPREWVGLLNKASHVVVPCVWNQEGFRESGVTVPIHVVPLGINPTIFSYMPPRDGDKFVVGVAGRVNHGKERKGVERAVDLFLSAFSGVSDVELRVKIHPDDPLPEIKNPKVQVTKEHMPWHKCREWFSGIDLFLSLARSEGFGLWQLQSMACGRPVMAARYSGLAEFMTEENSFCLPFTEESAANGMGAGMWSSVSDEAVKKSLLRAYSNREEIGRKGLLASETARQFTWDRTAAEVHQLLVNVGAFE